MANVVRELCPCSPALWIELITAAGSQRPLESMPVPARAISASRVFLTWSCSQVARARLEPPGTAKKRARGSWWRLATGIYNALAPCWWAWGGPGLEKESLTGCKQLFA